jgi:hypothetical protein
MKNKNYRLFEDGVWEKALKEANSLPIIDEKERCVGYFKECPEFLEGTTLELNINILEEQDGVITKCRIDSVSLVKNSNLVSDNYEPEFIKLS